MTFTLAIGRSKQMRILIISSTCSASKYQEVYEKRYEPMLDTNQKFFLSLIEGLNENGAIAIDCISTLPISHSCYPDKFVRQQQEIVDGVSYRYCGCINYPYIRTIIVKLNIRSLVKKYIRQYRSERIIVLCDGLIAEANAIVRLLQKKRITSVALVTDIPDIVSGMSSKKGIKSLSANLYGWYATRLLQNYDRYVFLTEQMNEVCNPNNRPYIIMECIVTPIALHEQKDMPLADKPVVLYAGKLHSDFGVLQLAKAAPLLAGVCEIWLYGGQGDCDEELKAIAKENQNLKIHGIVPLTEIQRIEQRADVLINPRPDEKEFTKYSFPSKTAEYMMMGTPTLMYRLAGVPSTYVPYLSFIDENSPEGIAFSIKRLLDEDYAMRKMRTENAREFIISNKNSLLQAKRLLEFLLK